MNKIPLIIGILLAGSIFYTVYSPHASMVKQHMDTYGINFEYITNASSSFALHVDPIGHDSRKYVLCLGAPVKPAIAEEPLYVMVGYTMKQVRLKNKSNVSQFQLSNTL